MQLSHRSCQQLLSAAVMWQKLALPAVGMNHLITGTREKIMKKWLAVMTMAAVMTMMQSRPGGFSSRIPPRLFSITVI